MGYRVGTNKSHTMIGMPIIIVVPGAFPEPWRSKIRLRVRPVLADVCGSLADDKVGLTSSCQPLG